MAFARTNALMLAAAEREEDKKKKKRGRLSEQWLREIGRGPTRSTVRGGISSPDMSYRTPAPERLPPPSLEEGGLPVHEPRPGGRAFDPASRGAQADFGPATARMPKASEGVDMTKMPYNYRLERPRPDFQADVNDPVGASLSRRKKGKWGFLGLKRWGEGLMERRELPGLREAYARAGIEIPDEGLLSIPREERWNVLAREAQRRREILEEGKRREERRKLAKMKNIDLGRYDPEAVERWETSEHLDMNLLGKPLRPPGPQTIWDPQTERHMIYNPNTGTYTPVASEANVPQPGEPGHITRDELGFYWLPSGDLHPISKQSMGRHKLRGKGQDALEKAQTRHYKAAKDYSAKMTAYRDEVKRTQDSMRDDIKELAFELEQKQNELDSTLTTDTKKRLQLQSDMNVLQYKMERKQRDLMESVDAPKDQQNPFVKQRMPVRPELSDYLGEFAEGMLGPGETAFDMPQRQQGQAQPGGKVRVRTDDGKTFSLPEQINEVPLQSETDYVDFIIGLAVNGWNNQKIGELIAKKLQHEGFKGDITDRIDELFMLSGLIADAPGNRGE